MAETVREIMNPELFAVHPDDSVRAALDGMLSLNVTAAPVVDSEWHALGIISIRDLVDVPRNASVGPLMSTPIAQVRPETTVGDAALRLGDSRFRHLLVVNEHGVAVGMVSAADLVRALVGLPARRPAAFPHFDLDTGLTWTDDTTLELDNVLNVAPDGPGTFMLVHGGALTPERVIWVEQCSDVRGRLLELLADPFAQPPRLRVWIERGLPRMRFRAARELPMSDVKTSSLAE
jgi:CBS domain-containing protein